MKFPTFFLRPVPLFPLLACAALALGLAGCGKDKEPEKTAAKPAATPAAAAAASPYQTSDQKMSYGLGFTMGLNLKRQPEFAADRNAIVAGLDDALAGTASRVPDAELQAAITAVREKALATLQAAGKAYLEKNKTKPGVKVTASGLQYEVLTKGTGAKPKPTDTVEVHYEGSLVNGSIFDSSIKRGQPAQLKVNGVIPGWTEALQLMSVGDKFRLVIPSELAYGARGNQAIPPNSVLIFEVQLLGIK